MKLFKKFGRKKGFLDLTKQYKKQQEETIEVEPNNQENSENSQSSSSGFSFLGNLASSSSSETQSNDYIPASDERTEKRKKLAKRLIDMTTKIEDLSNQIYHLQQRVEVLERKSGVGY